MPPRWFVVVLAIAAACARESADEGDGTTAVEATSTSTGVASTSDTSGGGDTSSTGTTGDGILQCIETCEVPAECCLPGTPCPGPYPYNVDCRDGLCVAPFCEDDADCPAAAGPMVCRPVRGVPTCVLPCADDDACVAVGPYYLCRGTTDEGERHCFEHCDQQGVFCGNATCDTTSGLCVCAGDGECLSDFVCRD